MLPPKLAGMQRIAGAVERVVLMSGCPGGPGDANANWVTTAWPPEAARVLAWQWDEVVIPYWKGLVAEAKAACVGKLRLELHGQQNVYNVETLFRLRDAVRWLANFSPAISSGWKLPIRSPQRGCWRRRSITCMPRTREWVATASVNSLIDTKATDRLLERSWSYVTLGYGHDLLWWREFCSLLRLVGYDDVLMEERKQMLPPLDGVRKSVELLQNVIARS